MTLDLWEGVDDPKKARILQAALRVFAEKGYAEATTRAIAAEAGVANGLLFYHFKDKKALFLELAGHLRAIVTKRFFGAAPKRGDFYERLAFLVGRKLELCAGCPDVYQLFLVQMRQFPEQYRKQGREARLFAPFRQGLRDDGVPAHRILLSALDGLVADLIDRFSAGEITADQLMGQGVAGAKGYIAFFRKAQTMGLTG